MDADRAKRHPGRAVPRSPRRFAEIGLVVAALYVGSYVALLAAGRYVPRPSGELRYENGFALLDRHEWRPAGLVWHRWRGITGRYIVDGNPPGWFYLPLLLIDRRLVHPTSEW